MVCKIIHLGINHHLLAEYHWKKRGEYWNITKIKAANSSENIAERSEAEFILEHYFGYNMLNATTTIEYAVEHPLWQIFPVIDFSLQAGIANLYGIAFAPFIQDVSTQSVFFAKGSPVIVRRPVKIKSVPLSM